MLQLHHYINKSVNPLCDDTIPTYDGSDFYIPPFSSVVLTPCNMHDPEHRGPSADSCQLLIRYGIDPTAKIVPLLVMYFIQNTSDTGLLLRHGDLLGAYYTGKHEHIKAERFFLLINREEYVSLMSGNISNVHVLMSDV
jgi:hypothetical protein